tara:strand:- start:1022 stop:2332 length:1311 start_codon:yes stop_codon:yes gene_type:complete
MNIEFGETRKTIGRHMLADGMSPVIDLEKSHGSWLVDGSTGKEYLDLFSMYASMSVGYNHPYVLENKERLTKASINKPANSDIYSPEMAIFVETVSRVSQPNYMPYAFFIEGGALAVENALKAAFDWKARKNLNMGKGLPKNLVIHLKDCFHGRSGYTMSLTDSPDPRKVQYFPKFDWPRITNPSMIFPMNEVNTCKVEKLETQSIQELKSILHDNADDVACLILEPIQGEGGDNHFRTEYLSELKELSMENDFLLIFDEVQTGVGITGKMWAHEHSNIMPDLMSFGKKTQCCGMFAGNRLNEVDGHVFKESSRINSTFGGNLVDMVRFTIYLELIEQENLVRSASENGKYLLSKLLYLQDKNSDVVTNSRGKGLFCAYDLPTTKKRDRLITIMEDLGVIVLGCGHRSIRFRPHLNIKKQEIDIAISMMAEGLSQL